jgi:hypothetical protein
MKDILSLSLLAFCGSENVRRRLDVHNCGGSRPLFQRLRESSVIRVRELAWIQASDISPDTSTVNAISSGDTESETRNVTSMSPLPKDRLS